MTWAITGTGMVSSLGGDVGSSFAGFRDGATSLAPLRVFDHARYRVRAAYELDDREPGAPDVPGRAGRWLCAAVTEALAGAGLDTGARIGVVVGTGLAEQRSLELWSTAGADLGMDDLDLAAALTRSLGLPDAVTIVNACSAGLFALAVGADLLAAGAADAVVVAASDSITESMFGLIDRVNQRPPEAVRPFDADRRGVILGEGAAAVVLEPVRSARARGATVAAVLRGVGTACDAHHVTAPLGAGIARAMRDAHRRAGVKPDEIDVVFAHGTGTVLNDVTEAAAMGEVFSEGGRPVVTALKSLIGHTAGASGLMGVVAAVESMRTGWVPPTGGLVTPIAEIRDFAVVVGGAELVRPRVAQVNAFGFGGVDAVAVLDRTGQEGTDPAPTGLAVVVTGVGTQLANVATPADLAAAALAGRRVDHDDGFDPHAVLGRRGVRYKDRATLLALCAATRALAAAGLPRASVAGRAVDPVDEAFGVVVSTSLGIARTVCQVVDTLHAGGVTATSPMDLPNVSGNATAAQVAIWFGLGGMNLTVSTGLDALRLAALAIGSGRASRVVVVGVEPADEVGERLLLDSARRHGDDPTGLPAVDGAAAVVLEAADAAGARGARVLAEVGGYTSGRDLAAVLPDRSDDGWEWYAPCRHHAAAAGQVPPWAPRPTDLSAATGEASGALGVLQAAVAADALAGRGGRAVLTAGGCWGAGYAALTLRGVGR